MTITEFLEARIAEDELRARWAAFGWGSSWESVTDEADEWSVVNAAGKPEMVGSEDGDVTAHMARWDPARVLAECAAKRSLIEAYDDEPGSMSCLTRLASVYKDHPDYDKRWAL